MMYIESEIICHSCVNRVTSAQLIILMYDVFLRIKRLSVPHIFVQFRI